MSLFDFQDPNQAGMLSLGLRLLSTPGPIGAALGKAGLGAIDDINAAQTRKQQDEARKLQMQQMQMALDESKRQAAAEAASTGYVKTLNTPTPPIGANAASGVVGPRPAALDAIGGMPKFNLGAALQAGVPLDRAFQLQQMLSKTKTPIKLGAGEQLLDPDTMGVMASNAKPEKNDLPSAVREYEYARSQGYGGTFDEWNKETKRAGASSVNVPINMGQKGFDNTLKLRGDFRSEPVYKAHQEMHSAYAQIKQSLNQASPAGDLAGATKIMKLLDPGSVVRESELGMAMAASGLLDRVQNYAGMVLNGTKLTPTQRADFRKLADALYSESTGQYNSKRAEYEGIAKRNGLSVDDVLGQPGQTGKANQPVRKFNPATGKIE